MQTSTSGDLIELTFTYFYLPSQSKVGEFDLYVKWYQETIYLHTGTLKTLCSIMSKIDDFNKFIVENKPNLTLRSLMSKSIEWLEVTPKQCFKHLVSMSLCQRKQFEVEMSKSWIYNILTENDMNVKVRAHLS